MALDLRDSGIDWLLVINCFALLLAFGLGAIFGKYYGRRDDS